MFTGSDWAELLDAVTVNDYRWLGGTVLDMATSIWKRNGLNYSTYGNINFSGRYRPTFNPLSGFDGAGVGLTGATPLGGVFFSLDNVHAFDEELGTATDDTYFTMGLAAGWDVSFDGHLTNYKKSNGSILTTNDVAGLQYHYAGGIASASVQQSGSINWDERRMRPVFNRVTGTSTSLSLGPTSMGPASGNVGLGYTINVSQGWRSLKSLFK
jgi:hypothetical protein